MPDATQLTCGICGESVDDRRLLAECFSCDRIFHLNPYSTRPGKDCGDSILGPTLGVETYCIECVEAERNAMLPVEAPVEGRRRFQRVDD